MENNVGIGIKLRLKALFIDYLCILAYLVIFFIIMISIYTFILNEIPEVTETQTQWITFLTTVFPVTVYFILKEARKPYVSFGKKKVGLKINYTGDPIKGSVIRNVLKFLPWHFGHVSVIKAAYSNAFTIPAALYYGLSIILLVTYILMAIFRRDHRHLPDLLSGSQVIKATE